MNQLWQDMRHGVRTFLKSPGFTAVAVLTLALGIGANTAIFSVVNAVLFRPLPYKEPNRLAIVYWQWAKGEIPAVTNTQYEFWKKNSRSFEFSAALGGGSFNLAGGSEPLRVRGWRASPELLPLLNVQPLMGRNFTKEEDTEGGPRALLISYGLWRSYYGGDPDVLKKTAQLNGNDYAIVGVLPGSFRLDSEADLLVPIRVVADPRDQGHNTGMLVRLAPGISLKQAQLEMDHLLPRFREAYPNHIGENERGVRLESYATHVVGDTRDTLLMLLGAVGLVLLIACANVANLMLARASSRTGELAVRTALGASRWRLARLLLTESMTLALAGGLAGCLVAAWALPLLLAATPAGLPRLGEIQLDAQTGAFAFFCSLFTSVIFGAVPAWRATRVDVHDALKTTSGKLSAGRAMLNARSALVVAEVALALILLVGAGLFLRSFTALNSVELGFDPKNLTALQVPLSAVRYQTTEASVAFQQKLLARIRSLPGVESAAAVPGLPFERGLNMYATIQGKEKPFGRSVEMRAITADYFRTVGIKVLRGRQFSDADANPGTREIFVNERFAKIFWDQQDPLGQTVNLGEKDLWVVAGVVSDIREAGLAYRPQPTFYMHAARVEDSLTRATNSWFPNSFLIRTSGPVDLNAALRGAVHEMDPLLPVSKIRPMTEVMATSISTERFLLMLMSVFAGLALVMTCVGIFSVLSYQVTQRTQEIGIRMALGASRTDVLGMVLRHGLLLAALGLAIGIGGAVAASRVVKTMLFQIQPTDPTTYVAVAVLLLCVAALACWIPARRATRVDPMVALRYE